MAGLTGDERLVLNAEIDAEIDVRMVTTDFGVTLDARGVCTVSLDDQGRLVEHRPDDSDIVAEQRWPGDTEQHAYEAAQIAARTRAALIEARLPFIAGTVFSHDSKLDLIRSAKAAGYPVALHVVLVPVEVSVARVRRRVDAGGHPVPEEKIRGRYERLWPLVRIAISLSDSASVWDEVEGRGPACSASAPCARRRRPRRGTTDC